MLKIRMQRVGRTNDPHFRFVLTDSRNSTKSGRFLEVLGHFDARRGGVRTIKADRVQHWLSHGAVPSDSVHNFVIRAGILTGAKRHVGKTKKGHHKTETKTNEGASSLAEAKGIETAAVVEYEVSETAIAPAEANPAA